MLVKVNARGDDDDIAPVPGTAMGSKCTSVRDKGRWCGCDGDGDGGGDVTRTRSAACFGCLLSMGANGGYFCCSTPFLFALLPLSRGVMVLLLATLFMTTAALPIATGSGSARANDGSECGGNGVKIGGDG